MCLVKTPKITPQATAEAAEKKINYFTNDYFGNRSSASSLNKLGRNSLRINRTSPSAAAPNRSTAPPITPVRKNPVAPTNPLQIAGLQNGGGGGLRDVRPRYDLQ